MTSFPMVCTPIVSFKVAAGISYTLPNTYIMKSLVMTGDPVQNGVFPNAGSLELGVIENNWWGYIRAWSAKLWRPHSAETT